MSSSVKYMEPLDKLGLRDRSLVTITSLISQGITEIHSCSIFSRQKRTALLAPGNSRNHPHIGFYTRLA